MTLLSRAAVNTEFVDVRIQSENFVTSHLLYLEAVVIDLLLFCFIYSLIEHKMSKYYEFQSQTQNHRPE